MKTVHLSLELHKALKFEAVQKNTTIEKVTNEILSSHLDTQPAQKGN